MKKILLSIFSIGIILLLSLGCHKKDNKASNPAPPPRDRSGETSGNGSSNYDYNPSLPDTDPEKRERYRKTREEILAKLDLLFKEGHTEDDYYKKFENYLRGRVFGYGEKEIKELYNQEIMGTDKEKDISRKKFRIIHRLNSLFDKLKTDTEFMEKFLKKHFEKHGNSNIEDAEVVFLGKNHTSLKHVFFSALFANYFLQIHPDAIVIIEGGIYIQEEYDDCSPLIYKSFAILDYQEYMERNGFNYLNGVVESYRSKNDRKYYKTITHIKDKKSLPTGNLYDRKCLYADYGLRSNDLESREKILENALRYELGKRNHILILHGADYSMKRRFEYWQEKCLELFPYYANPLECDKATLDDFFEDEQLKQLVYQNKDKLTFWKWPREKQWVKFEDLYRRKGMYELLKDKKYIEFY